MDRQREKVIEMCEKMVVLRKSPEVGRDESILPQGLVTQEVVASRVSQTGRINLTARCRASETTRSVSRCGAGE